MAAHGFDDRLEGHGAAFRVSDGFRQGFGRERGDQLHVIGANGSEECQGGLGVVGGIGLRPSVLIEGLDDVVRFGQCLQKAIGENDLAIGKMAEDFANGPLAWGWGLVGTSMTQRMEIFAESGGG